MCDKFENDVNEVIPNLWLGNIKAAYNRNFLTEYKIKYILTVMDDFNEQYRYNDIIYLTIPIKDENTCDVGNMINFFETATLFILQALQKNEAILVHCKAGHHRSAAIVCAFLFKYLKVNYLSTLSYINYLRPCALVRKTCMSDNLFNYYLYINNIKSCNKTCGLTNNIYTCKCACTTQLY